MSLQFCGNEDNMPSLALPTTTEKELIHQARCLLSKTWDWLIEVMNSIEEQLRAGEEFDTEVSPVSVQGLMTIQNFMISKLPYLKNSCLMIALIMKLGVAT